MIKVFVNNKDRVVCSEVRFHRTIIEVELDINITRGRTFSEACPSRTITRGLRVMAEEEGEALERNAREMQKVVGDRAKQEQYVDELVDYLRRYK